MGDWFAGKIRTAAIAVLRHTVWIVDEQFGWVLPAIWKGWRILRYKNGGVVYSYSKPNSAHLIALALKKLCGVKWVAEFRDLWTQNEFAEYSTVQNMINEKCERAVVGSADMIIVNTPMMKKKLCGKYKGIDQRVHVVTNGYDESDYENITVPSGNETIMNILMSGSLYSENGMISIFNVLSNIEKSQGLSKGKVEIVLIGEISTAYEDAVKDLGLQSVVKCMGYISHGEYIDCLNKSDPILFYEDEKIKHRWKARLFEYLRAGKPILAFVPEGHTKELLVESGLAFFPDKSSSHGMKAAIENAVEMFRDGRLKEYRTNVEFLGRFEWKGLADKVSTIIRELVEK